jgi:outer membrane biogenesis lipoprotein LolB
MMKKLSILVVVLTVVLIQGCAPLTQTRPLVEDTTRAEENTNKRFQIIQEEGETNNIGGYTVMKDTATGKEYLIVTGLNGSSTVTDLN